MQDRVWKRMFISSAVCLLVAIFYLFTKVPLLVSGVFALLSVGDFTWGLHTSIIGIGNRL